MGALCTEGRMRRANPAAARNVDRYRDIANLAVCKDFTPFHTASIDDDFQRNSAGVPDPAPLDMPVSKATRLRICLRVERSLSPDGRRFFCRQLYGARLGQLAQALHCPELSIGAQIGSI